MAARIVLFGATGYTGRLAAEAMVERGLRPVLAARGRERLEAMAAELGGLETAVADVADPAERRELVERGDVLVTTVGPFARWGAPGRRGRLDGRRALHRLDRRAGVHPRGVRALRPRRRAVRRRDAHRVRDTTGCPATSPAGWRWSAPARRPCGSTSATSSPARRGMSGGTMASTRRRDARDLSFGFRDGRIQTERGAKRVRSFQVGSTERDGDLGRQLRALRAAAGRSAAARGQRLPRLVRPALARRCRSSRPAPTLPAGVES